MEDESKGFTRRGAQEGVGTATTQRAEVEQHRREEEKEEKGETDIYSRDYLPE